MTTTEIRTTPEQIPKQPGSFSWDLANRQRLSNAPAEEWLGELASHIATVGTTDRSNYLHPQRKIDAYHPESNISDFDLLRHLTTDQNQINQLFKAPETTKHFLDVLLVDREYPADDTEDIERKVEHTIITVLTRTVGRLEEYFDTFTPDRQQRIIDRVWQAPMKSGLSHLSRPQENAYTRFGAKHLGAALQLESGDNSIILRRHLHYAKNYRTGMLHWSEALVREREHPAVQQFAQTDPRVNDYIEYGKYGLNIDYLRDIWAAPANTKNIPAYTERNERAIEQLEATTPDICRVLIDDFGIHNFSRYPVAVLQDMHANRHNANTPYVLGIYGRTDASNALEQNGLALKELHKQLDAAGILLRLVEVGANDHIHTVMKFKRRYAAGQAIAGFISSHGGVSFEMRDTKIRNDEGMLLVGSTDILEMIAEAPRLYQSMLSLLQREAPIMMNSCEEGKPGRVAQQLSLVLPGHHVTAATGNVNIKALTYDEVSGLDIMYHNTEGEQQDKVVYRIGQIISQTEIPISPPNRTR